MSMARVLDAPRGRRRRARAEPVHRLRGRRGHPARRASPSPTPRRCTRPRPPSSPSASRSRRSGTSTRSPSTPPPAGGRRSSRRASPTGACCCSATAASARPSPRGSRRSRWSSPRSRARARVEDGMPVHGVDELPALLARRRDRDPDASRRRRDPAHRRRRVPVGAAGRRARRQRRPRARSSTPTRSSTTCGRGRIRAALDVTDPEPLPDGPPALDACPACSSRRTSAARRARCARGSRGSCARQIERMLGGRAAAQRRHRRLTRVRPRQRSSLAPPAHRWSMSAPDQRSAHSTSTTPWVTRYGRAPRSPTSASVSAAKWERAIATGCPGTPP